MYQKEVVSLDDLQEERKNCLLLDEDSTAKELSGKRLRQSVFLRMGLRSIKLRSCMFHQCIFDTCYFRIGRFDNTDFTGSFFINCNLSKTEIVNCTFKYVRFRKCLLEYDEILGSLPAEPNIALLLLRELKQNALEMGEKNIFHKLLLKEVEYEEKELKNSFLCKTSYYKKKFDWLARCSHFFRYVKSKLEGFFLGHGLQIWKLLRTAFLAIFGFAFLQQCFGIFYYSQTQTCDKLNFSQSLYLSVITFTTLGYGDYAPSTGKSILICSIESLFGILFLGFLAAAIFKVFSK